MVLNKETFLIYYYDIAAKKILRPVEKFISAEFNKKIDEAGDFTVEMYLNSESYEFVQIQNYLLMTNTASSISPEYASNSFLEIWLPEKVSIETDDSGDRRITISGQYFTKVLNRRIIWSPINIGITADQGYYESLTENLGVDANTEDIGKIINTIIDINCLNIASYSYDEETKTYITTQNTMLYRRLFQGYFNHIGDSITNENGTVRQNNLVQATTGVTNSYSEQYTSCYDAVYDLITACNAGLTYSDTVIEQENNSEDGSGEGGVDNAFDESSDPVLHKAPVKLECYYDTQKDTLYFGTFLATDRSGINAGDEESFKGYTITTEDGITDTVQDNANVIPGVPPVILSDTMNDVLDMNFELDRSGYANVARVVGDTITLTQDDGTEKTVYYTAVADLDQVQVWQQVTEPGASFTMSNLQGDIFMDKGGSDSTNENEPYEVTEGYITGQINETTVGLTITGGTLTPNTTEDNDGNTSFSFFTGTLTTSDMGTITITNLAKGEWDDDGSDEQGGEMQWSTSSSSLQGSASKGIRIPIYYLTNKAGANRFEVGYESDVSFTNELEQTAYRANYLTRLQNDGQKKLASEYAVDPSYEITLRQTEDSNFLFGRDFALGDYVRVYDSTLRSTFKLQVTECRYSITNEDGLETELTLGKQASKLNKRLNTMTLRSYRPQYGYAAGELQTDAE